MMLYIRDNEMRAEGRKEGRKEGHEEGTKERSLNLYRLGISIENIAAGANVSTDQVRRWIAEANSIPAAA